MTWHLDAEFISLAFLLLLLFDINKNSQANSPKDRVFRLLVPTTALMTGFSIVSSLSMEQPAGFPSWLTTLTLLAYFILLMSLPLLWMLYAIMVLTPKVFSSRVALLVIFLPWAACMLATMATPLTGFIYAVDVNNVYTRGHGFFLLYVMLYSYNLATLALALRWFHTLERSKALVMCAFSLLSLAGVSLQAIMPGYLWVSSASTMAILITYLFLQNRKITLDDLTGLFNRPALRRRLERLSASKHKGRIMTVSLSDFKFFNQMFGQQSGDMLLRAVADFLHAVAGGNTAYRYGGDQFALLLPEDDHTDAVIEAVAARFRAPWHVDGGDYITPVNMAVVDYPLDAENDFRGDLFSAMEFALYEVRRRKVGMVTDSGQLAATLRRRHEVRAALERAMNAAGAQSSLPSGVLFNAPQKGVRSYFSIVYQPIYDLRTGRFNYAEALLRLHDTILGPLSPAEFIPIAEENGLIVEMTLYVIDQVCQFLKQIPPSAELWGVSVNLSILHFMQECMANDILDILNRNDLSPSRLKLEITESLLPESFERVRDCMLRLVDHGVAFALDDYGTGYSSLTYILRLPFTIIKLDRSIVASVTEDSTLVDSVISMVHKLGKRVIAEGVETEEVSRILQILSCDLIQGFFYARPMSANELIALVTSEDTDTMPGENAGMEHLLP